ncbi:MAG: hypothetical protein AAB309_03600 [Deltaproteobacteria bacterium]
MTGLTKLVDHYSLKDIVLESLSIISARCSQKQYGEMLPHALMGLEAAWQIGEFFHSKNRVLPIAQMLWYAVNEARQPAVDFKKGIGTPPARDDLHFESFKKIYENESRHHQLKETFRYFVFLIRDPLIRKKIFSYLLQNSLRNEASVGHKLIYLMKSYEFSQATEWQNFHIWYPPLHYLIQGGEAVYHFPLVSDFYKKHEKVFLDAKLGHAGEFSLEGLGRLRESVLNDEKEETLEKIKTFIMEGESLFSLFEMLKLISAQVVYQCSFDRWPTAIHGFHYIYGLSLVFSDLEREDRGKALLMSALFLKKMAVLSKPFSEIALKAPQTIDEKNRPLYFVEYAISRGDVAAALGAADHLLKEKPADSTTLETLAFLSSKNLYSVLYGHDIKFAYACLRSYKMMSYKNSAHPLRNQYLLSLVKLLAEMPKEHTIYHSVMNCQEIKPFGYFSV